MGDVHLSWRVKQTGRAHLAARIAEWGKVRCSDPALALDDARLLWATEGCSQITLLVDDEHMGTARQSCWWWAPEATWVRRG